MEWKIEMPDGTWRKGYAIYNYRKIPAVLEYSDLYHESLRDGGRRVY